VYLLFIIDNDACFRFSLVFWYYCFTRQCSNTIKVWWDI